jgi:hypothetical protein
VALHILLSALEHPTGRDPSRVIKYRRQGREARAVFRGGIVCISNRELHDDELLGAFKSRVHTLNYDPTDAQLGALMLDIADRGWPCGTANPEIGPEAARAVTHYLLSSARDAIDRAPNAPGSTNLGDAWHPWAECQALREEAESLLSRQAKPPPK